MAQSREKRTGLVEHHHQSLTLAFPVATRRAPANFNIAAAWTAGVQMAALSLGCESDGAVLAHAGRFFQDNGGCGYVLKPPHLRSEPEVAVVPSGDSGANAPVRVELRLVAARAVPGLDSIGGQESGQLAAAASVWGAPEDCSRKVYPPVRWSGPVVTWPDAEPKADGSLPKPMVFQVSSPSTAVLVLEVFGLDHCKGGQRRLAFFAAPVDGLRQGLRWAPLYEWPTGGNCVQPVPCGPLSGLLVHAAIKRDLPR